MPEISIIIPVYNVEKYLKTCVESILSQDFQILKLYLLMIKAPILRAKCVMSLPIIA